MSRQYKINPLSATVGAAFLASAMAAPVAQAAAPAGMAENPFAANDLSGGYQQLAGNHGDGKHGEGKCGEGKCGEGKCGGDGDKDEDKDKGGEGKCGEGRCGG